jgi:hypothetical protein
MAAVVGSSYDLAVTNAMIEVRKHILQSTAASIIIIIIIIIIMRQVDTAFQEMLCKACAVDDEEQLPQPLQDLDVVKFAEMSPEIISSTLTAVLTQNIPEGAQAQVKEIVLATLSAVAGAKQTAEGAGAVWPATIGGSGEEDGGTNKTTFSLDSEAAERSAEAKKYMTGKYDFKVMRRLTAIENKLLDKLCGFYGVEDEDALPEEIQQISLSEMFDAGEAVPAIRAKVESQLMRKPWGGMDATAMAVTVDELAAALEPVMESINASIAEARRASDME